MKGDRTQGGEYAIEVSSLGAGYGEGQVLEDLTFSVPRGSITTLLGPNGSGKSTLVRVLLGLIEPDTGSVALSDGSGRGLSPSQIGYVPQLKTLDFSFPASVEDLVSTGLDGRWPSLSIGWKRGRTQKQVQDSLDRAGIGHLSGRQIRGLSGGELQRTYLARSLIRRPRLIFLDEPAAGIDPTGEEDLYRILKEYRNESGATIFMVTHDIQVAKEIGDYVILLNRRLIGAGPPAVALSRRCLDQLFVYSREKPFGGESHCV